MVESSSETETRSNWHRDRLNTAYNVSRIVIPAGDLLTFSYNKLILVIENFGLRVYSFEFDPDHFLFNDTSDVAVVEYPCYCLALIFMFLQNDLKRKYSVVPVDEEVRSICATTSSSNFKAFILTTNPSQCEYTYTYDLVRERNDKVLETNDCYNLLFI